MSMVQREHPLQEIKKPSASPYCGIYGFTVWAYFKPFRNCSS